MTDIFTEPQPKGFEVSNSPEGCPVVTYRSPGQWMATVVAVFWILASIGGIFMTTYFSLIGAWRVSAQELVGLVLFWIPITLVMGLALWDRRAICCFTLFPDHLAIERSLFGYRRRQEILKHEIEVVRQIDSRRSLEADSSRSFNLVVLGYRNVRLLSRQDFDKSAWLGPVVARWAEVPYLPWDSNSRLGI